VRGVLPAHAFRVKSCISKRFACFAARVLAVAIGVVPVKLTVTRADASAAVARVIERLFVRERMHIKRSAGVRNRKRKVEVKVVLGIIGLANNIQPGVIITFVRPEVSIRIFMGNIDQIGQAKVLHLPLIIPVACVIPLAIKSVLGYAQMKIFWIHSGVNINRSVFIKAGNIKRPVVHDIVPVNLNAEAVSNLHHVKQVGFRSVTRRDAVALVFGSKVERVPQVVTDRKAAAALCRRRKPKRTVANFCEFRHLLGKVTPGNVEVLKHDFARVYSRHERQYP